MSINVEDVRAIILIGDAPDFKNGKTCNYCFLSTAQLIKKLLVTIFGVSDNNILTCAFNYKEEYQMALQKTNNKTITQINVNDVYFFDSLDTSNYIYFDLNPKDLYNKIEDFVCSNQNIFLFLLDHGETGRMNTVDYGILYQSIIRNNPKSLHIINDCCYGGSLISVIKAYSKLYNKLSSIFKMETIDARFLSSYFYILEIVGIAQYKEKSEWLTKIIEKKANWMQLEICFQALYTKTKDLLSHKQRIFSDQTISLEKENIQQLNQAKWENKMLNLFLEAGICTTGELEFVASVMFFTLETYPKLTIKKLNEIFNLQNLRAFEVFCGKSPLKNQKKFDLIKQIDLKRVIAPISDHKIFTSGGEISRSFSYASIRISPDTKVIAGTPGAMEAIREAFFKISNDDINFEKTKETLIGKENKYNEYPIQVKVNKEKKHRILWARPFPKSDSSGKLNSDRIFSLILPELSLRIASMQAILQLMWKEFESLSNLISSNVGNLEINSLDKDDLSREEWVQQRADAKIMERDIEKASALSIISAIAFRLPRDEIIKSIKGKLNKAEILNVLMSVSFGSSPIKAAEISSDSFIELRNILNSILDVNKYDSSQSMKSAIFEPLDNDNNNKLYGSALIITVMKKMSIDVEQFIGSLKELFESIDMESDTLVQNMKGKTNLEIISIFQLEIFNIFNERIKNINESKELILDPVKREFDRILKEEEETFKIEEQIVIKDQNVIDTLHNVAKKVGGSVISGQEMIFQELIRDKEVTQLDPDEIENKAKLLALKIKRISNRFIRSIHEYIPEEISAGILNIIASDLPQYNNYKIDGVIKLVSFSIRKKILDKLLFPRNPIKLNEFITPLQFSSQILNEMKIQLQTKEPKEEDDNIVIKAGSYCVIDEKDLSFEKGIEILNERYKGLGKTAAIESVISWYFDQSPIITPILDLIESIPINILKDVSIQIKEEDLIMLAGLGRFELDNSDKERIRHQYSSEKISESDVYSQDIFNEPTFKSDYDDYYSDGGEFQESISFKDNDLGEKSKQNRVVYTIDQEEKEILQKRILDLRESFEKDIWKVFSWKFTERARKLGIDIDLNQKKKFEGCSMMPARVFNATVSHVFGILPFSQIYDFWTHKKYIENIFATHHDKEKELSAAFLESFEDANCVVTPMYFDDFDRYYPNSNLKYVDL